MFNLTPMVRNLLFLNLGMMLLTSAVMPSLQAWLALYPVQSELFQPYQLITYMFLHSGLMHIFSNMFGLISFGPMLEQRWGEKRFLLFWMVCGVGAGLIYSGIRYYELSQMYDAVQAFRAAPSGTAFSDFFRDYAPAYADAATAVARDLQQHATDPDKVNGALSTLNAIYEQALNGPMVGASGALFGVLLAFAYLFPNTELMLLFFPFPIKAKYFVALYGIYELYAGVERNPGDNVAHFAHLGGMLFGFLLLKYWEKRHSRFY
ncbi:rhomboid family intramembrane serine protease [Hymenobacter busanensis]|uniref:Rhomboid family intramembrane serine protease n=1 Tax=Hymenobacter busanensis TaxID=2607656 RepID=A0A7L4ZYR0_9BACT|nr:rhomboid family intramembrane serine protease [Hymenobacter busanensis]KAA9332301.1 rhomboid family intramembrane serine protease [Hymenobacter busanensis]QHJ07362.1 rhomboid family intramembrane serine protease [Hymenobacter busanensis]